MLTALPNDGVGCVDCGGDLGEAWETLAAGTDRWRTLMTCLDLDLGVIVPSPRLTDAPRTLSVRTLSGPTAV